MAQAANTLSSVRLCEVHTLQTMSHISTFAAAKFSDIALLCEAFKKLGWAICTNTTIRTYSDREAEIKFPYVAVNPLDGYDIGLRYDTKNNVWTLNSDFGMSASHIHDTLSAMNSRGLEKLQQQYTFALCDNMATTHNGNTSEVEVLADGTITGVMTMEVDLDTL